MNRNGIYCVVVCVRVYIYSLPLIPTIDITGTLILMPSFTSSGGGDSKLVSKHVDWNKMADRIKLQKMRLSTPGICGLRTW